MSDVLLRYRSEFPILNQAPKVGIRMSAIAAVEKIVSGQGIRRPERAD